MPDQEPNPPFVASRVRLVPLAELAEYSANAREHPEEQLEQLVGLIRRFGFTDPVLLHEGVLVAGHGRLEAARRVGLLEVPAIDLEHLSPGDARALRIAHNRVSDRSGWNPATLAAELEAMRREGEDLALVGFSRADLDRVLRELEAAGTPRPPAVEVERPAEDAGPVVARTGDVWVLGDHRVACGDSRLASTWSALRAGEDDLAACVFTDPPYGIEYESEASGARVRNDSLVGDALVQLLALAFEQASAHARENAAWYVWHPGGDLRDDFVAALRATGLVELQYLVWAKPSPTLGRADYQWAHEACFYAARQGARPCWFGARDQGTVWRVGQRAAAGATSTVLGSGIVVQSGTGQSMLLCPVPARAAKMRRVRTGPDAPLFVRQDAGEGTVWEVARDHAPEHPTQKPVELVTKGLLNSTLVGELVLDPFGGGGSLVLGAERTGRRARAVELEPAWVDLVVRRWSAETGREATLLKNGHAWSRVARDRAPRPTRRAKRDT